MFRPLWIEVDLKALSSNFKLIKGYVGRQVKIAATIKQCAYGHGLIPVARKLAGEGIDFFGVGSIEEAVALRKDGFRGSVLILSTVFDNFAEHFIRHKITATLVDLKFARKLNREAQKADKVVPAHVKVDTGMGRLGQDYRNAAKFVRSLRKLNNISLEGIYTHFPAADIDPEFTNFQIAVFNRLVEKLKQEGVGFKFLHCANSIGIIKYPDAHFNMVRPGLILYGINPAPDLTLNLKSCLSLKAKVIFMKKVGKGTGVSYSRTYIASSPRNIATVAVGYADGYPWALSNRAKVIINNRLFKVAGRVCMDHIMVDLGKTEDIKPGDEVILLGHSRNAAVSAEDLARWAETIPYEIVSRLSLKIPRVYKFT